MWLQTEWLDNRGGRGVYIGTRDRAECSHHRYPSSYISRLSFCLYHLQCPATVIIASPVGRSRYLVAAYFEMTDVRALIRCSPRGRPRRLASPIPTKTGGLLIHNTGKIEQIGGVESYVAIPTGDYPKDKVILFLSDVFGIPLINNKASLVPLSHTDPISQKERCSFSPMTSRATATARSSQTSSRATRSPRTRSRAPTSIVKAGSADTARTAGSPPSTRSLVRSKLRV